MPLHAATDAAGATVLALRPFPARCGLDSRGAVDEASPVEIQGHCEPRFAGVRDAFRANFERHGEVGAACCVYQRGVPVVDLWGGLADPVTREPWRRDTAAIVFSTTKGVTALCAAMLAERGVLDVDAPIARAWPEFAARGKEAIPARWVLSHRAGLAVVEGDLTLEEVLAWEPVVTAIARQAPVWEPGTAHGYHVRSYGWILGELVRRITGKTIGRFLAEEVSGPLGLELWIGLPEDLDHRAARIVPPPPADAEAQALLDRFAGPDTLLGRAMSGPSNLFHYDEMWNRRALRAAEMPSSNAVATARGIARLYAAAIDSVDGVRLLRRESIERLRRVESEGPDKILLLPTRFGLGAMLPPALSPRAAAGCFGHPGAGGSLGLADPEAGIAFGYVMNQMKLGVTGDERSASLLEAVYASLRD
jgi:CubicO group peptidase (beta-lactamase class C family)